MKSIVTPSCLILALSLAGTASLAGTVHAADHIDGPTVILDAAADITDLFAFTKPNAPGKLVLILDVHPLADSLSRFSNAVTYSFRVRSAGGTAVYEIRCNSTSTGLLGLDTQRITCTTPSGLTSTVAMNDTSGGTVPGLRVFAGLRSDPFFIDLPAVILTSRTGDLSLLSGTGINTTSSQNVLSIAVEVDAQTEFGSEILEVVGETVRSDFLGTRRIDRAGLVEVTTLMLREEREKDSYNREDSYNVSPEGAARYTALWHPNMMSWDAMDGLNDWTPDGGLHPLAAHLLGDYLMVDVSKPCDVNTPSYFEIDLEAFGGPPHTTCGGRTPNDDVIDETITLIVNGPLRATPRRSDGVNAATKPSTNTFPYLASPNIAL